MSPFDAFWHVANILASAWAIAALMALAAKLLWRRDCKGLAWRRLVLWGGWGGSAGVFIALVLLGRDGKMLGYGILIACVALPQWWLMIRR